MEKRNVNTNKNELKLKLLKTIHEDGNVTNKQTK